MVGMRHRDDRQSVDAGKVVGVAGVDIEHHPRGDRTDLRATLARSAAAGIPW
jgi:hypothetical protein